MEPQGHSLRRVGWWWAGAVLAVLLIATAGVVTRRGANAAAKPKAKTKTTETAPAAPVEVAAVRHGPIATFLHNTTTLEARRSATLVARRKGQVTAIPIEEGAWVQAGAVLARLDDHEANLAVQRGELASEIAKRELERGRQLEAKGYLSAREIDDLELKLKNAWVELEQARYDLAQTRITAPYAGRIVQRSIQLGETVAEGEACFRIDAFDPILARVYFPERDLARVRVGQPATLTLDAQPGAVYPARVSLVSPVVDRANGTIKVTLEIPNGDGRLRPGAFARVRLKTGEHPDALLLPRRALIKEDGESYVFVARGDSVARATVQVGAIEGEDAQVLSGLAAGDRVVTVGQGGLKPGARIKAVAL